MLKWPLDKIYITQRFGVDEAYYSRYGMRGHNGVDLRARTPKPVRASMDGRIANISNKNGYGLHVKQKNHKYELCYAHLKNFTKPSGSFVKTGDIIGYTNNTGDSRGAHLHFGVRELGLFGKVKNYRNGFYGWKDPLRYLENNQKEMSIIEQIIAVFRTRHSQDEVALVIVPEKDGEVYLLKGGKKIRVKGLLKLVEALAALHAIGIKKSDLDKIPDGGKL